uniref:Uncharacterized protein n=1 Tax=Salmo trutta TaxID=8032 RepID=A0A673XMB1_SALTR
ENKLFVGGKGQGHPRDQSEEDILSPAAMQNVYYISHNAVDCLEFRGFGWPDAAWLGFRGRTALDLRLS